MIANSSPQVRYPLYISNVALMMKRADPDVYCKGGGGGEFGRAGIGVREGLWNANLSNWKKYLILLKEFFSQDLLVCA